GDLRRAARGDGHGDRAHDDRCLHHQPGSREADLRRDPDGLQHRAARGGRACDRAGPPGGRAARADPARRDSLGRSAEGHVAMGDFGRAFTFMGDNAHLLLEKSVDTLALSGAARGMGMTPLEVVARVELPLAIPLTFAGIRTAAVYVVATSPLAGFVGGGGLGDIIVNQPQYRLAGVLAAAIVIAALAFATEVLLALVQRALTPRALRAQARAPAIGPATREMTA